MKRMSYSVEITYKAVEMKAVGFSTKEIMKELTIRNRTQMKTRWRWYQNEKSKFVSYIYSQSLIIYSILCAINENISLVSE
ncbi:hypothetical protein SEVCU121_0048 [Staphylococcus warneri VCU121]|nr:hypothetical protein SEVCU121_0048 [Staphylococcus warneri VCU121]